MTQVNGGDMLVTLIGDRTTQDDGGAGAAAAALLDRKELKAIEFDSSRLGRWDSSLLVYLVALRYAAAPRSIRIDDSGIPIAARQLLALLQQQQAVPTAVPPAVPSAASPERADLGGGSKMLNAD